MEKKKNNPSGDYEYVRNGRNLLQNIGIELEKLREMADRHKPKYIPPVPRKIIVEQLNLNLDI